MSKHPTEPTASRHSLLDDQRRRWSLGERITVADYLVERPDLTTNDDDLVALIESECSLRREAGEVVEPHEYLQRFAHLADRLLVFLGTQASADSHANSVLQTTSFGPSGSPGSDPWRTVTSARPVSDSHPANESEMPQRIGRYEVVGKLGAGGFGVVLKARDSVLQRDVAIKLTHIPDPAYVEEARKVAALDHPGIVPVHDVGVINDGRGYVISKFLSGGDLSSQLKSRRYTHKEAARLMIAVAEALHHAHRRGLVHRDIKPANILLGENGEPLVADFGLALSSAEFGRAKGIVAGTIAYTSPEQARGESDFVDARSDVYSLGIVLYELLTAQRPYRSQSQRELLHEIANVDVRPPRQIDDTVPVELDRICLKALAKRPADRYSTALDLSQELRRWLDDESSKTTVSDGQPKGAPSRAVSDAPASGGRAKGTRVSIGMRLGKFKWVLSFAVTSGAVLMAAFVVLRRDSEDPSESWATRATLPVPHGDVFITSFNLVLPDGRRLDDRDLPLAPTQLGAQLTLNQPGYCYLLYFDQNERGRIVFPRELASARPERQFAIGARAREPTIVLPNSNGASLILAICSSKPLVPSDFQSLLDMPLDLGVSLEDAAETRGVLMIADPLPAADFNRSPPNPHRSPPIRRGEPGPKKRLVVSEELKKNAKRAGGGYFGYIVPHKKEEIPESAPPP